MIHEQISIDSYKIFNAAAETGSITKAAAGLFISQPAVSKAIAKLEQQLGAVLFTRSSKGVKLTNEGKLLHEYTRSAFSKLREGEDALRQYSQLGTSRIRIGTSTTLCRYLLLPQLKEFTALHPQIRITIQCRSTFQTLDMLEQGKADIGLVGKPGSLPDGFCFTPLTEIEDIFAASPIYLEHLKQNLENADILLENGNNDFEKLISAGCLMLLDEENITRQYLDHYFGRLNIQAGSILEVSSMDLLIEFAKIGLGTACVIQSFVQNELDSGQLVKLIPGQKLKKREAGFVYHAGISEDEPAAKFIQFCHM